MNSWVAISLFVAPSATGCAQLDACSFREGFHAEVAEETVRDTQLLAGVDVATNAAQPLAIHQMSTGEVKAQCRRSQAIDGVAILALRGVVFAQERTRS